jgi:3-hydroxymyristoyl/3-hydroxydecanoyl-(acyl carrier protein) dehydratase
VPGVLLAEALAQISGIAGASGATSGKSGMLAHVDVKFEKPVAPPATIVLRAKLTATMGSLQKFEVAALVNDATVAAGTITLHRSE